MIRQDGVVDSHLKTSDTGPRRLGDYPVVYNTPTEPLFVGEVSLGISWSTPIEDR